MTDKPCSEESHKALEDAAMPAWEEEASKDLPADEVRRRWPRGHWARPHCDHHGIVYASSSQYYRGDY